jgi:hypothetical protein
MTELALPHQAIMHPPMYNGLVNTVPVCGSTALLRLVDTVAQMQHAATVRCLQANQAR